MDSMNDPTPWPEQVAALRAEVERLRDELAETAESEGNNSRSLEMSIQREEKTATRLAAATELLRRTYRMLCEEGISAALFRDIDAFLAAQPAAPDRTEAEQRVLDACAALSTGSLEAFGKPASTPWVKFAHAELARRDTL